MAGRPPKLWVNILSSSRGLGIVRKTFDKGGHNPQRDQRDDLSLQGWTVIATRFNPGCFLLEYSNSRGAPPIPDDPFAPLRERFLARCADQLAELKAAHQAPPLPGNEPLIRVAHSLAGAAGTFGFAEISKQASILEMLLVERADGGSVHAALAAVIAEIERTLE
ncbi:Hpt domain-containing protein [Mesorhizobium sp. CA8]|uniref:Hpt domain-containing protein n=1 Tax=Mesorhizobium sp. CA8 TaxID=2876637 RepID=UPI001CC93CD7|nr:Hpt domain-containing protein [Mesorhizobium sp. CA8]MBZ9763992.1 Hpt domain-containing protein [Mesorhizobium sp. CA8]